MSRPRAATSVAINSGVVPDLNSCKAAVRSAFKATWRRKEVRRGCKWPKDLFYLRLVSVNGGDVESLPKELVLQVYGLLLVQDEYQYPKIVSV